jgi:hypothetical protein
MGCIAFPVAVGIAYAALRRAEVQISCAANPGAGANISLDQAVT